MPDPDDENPFARLPDPYEEDWQRRQAEREQVFIDAVANAGGTPVITAGGDVGALLEEETPMTDAEYHAHIMGTDAHEDVRDWIDDHVEVENTAASIPARHQNGGLTLGEHIELRGRELDPGSIRFSVGGGVEVLRFDPDGKAYVQGKLVEQPEEVIHALRWFLGQINHENREPRVAALYPSNYRVPKFVLGQKLRCPDGFVGVVVTIFYGINITETWEHFLRGPRYDDNQVFYGLYGADGGDRALVGEHSAVPVVPTDEPVPKFTRVSVWERLLAEMLSGVNSGT